jgi:thiol-disulfide isomerase/thioredoxin
MRQLNHQGAIARQSLAQRAVDAVMVCGRAMRMPLLVAMFAGLMVAPQLALAQTKSEPAKSEPAKTEPAITPDGVSKADPAAAALLARAKETWSRVSAMSARANLSSEGYTDQTTQSSAALAAAKAQVGDWKIAVREDVGAASEEDGKGGSEDASKSKKRGIEIAYDGATARSIRHKDKAVVQRTLVKVSQVRDFFVLQEAAGFVPWALLDPEVLASPKYVTNLGAARVGAIDCTMIEVSDQEPLDAEDQSRPRESTVLYIDEKTGIVHRVDSVIERAKPSKRFVRSLTLSDVRLNDNALLQDFAPATPDGYAVRTRGGAVGGKGGSEGGGKLGGGTKGKDEQAGGNALPHGITWAHEARALQAGAKLPKFSLKNPKGETKNNESYAGKVLVIDVWGTWCPPCRAAMPALQRVHEKFANKAVAVVGFNVERDPEADPEAFKKKNKYTYELLLQADDLMDSMKVSGFPTFYVVSPEGNVVWAGVGLAGPPGVAKPTSRQIVEYLEETLTKLVEGELKKLEGGQDGKQPEEKKSEENKPSENKPSEKKPGGK